jgi:hypothetical protein
MTQDEIDALIGHGEANKNSNVKPLTSSLQPLLEPAKQPFHKNPWFKIGAVGGGLLFFVWFIGQAFSSGTTSPTTTTQAALASGDQDLVALAQRQQQEIDQLKANMALDQQIQDQQIPKPTPTPKPLNNVPQPRTALPPQPARTTPSTPFRVSPNYRRTYNRPTAPSYPAYPTYSGPPAREVDPLTQWQQLAGMNTFYAPGGNEGSPQPSQQAPVPNQGIDSTSGNQRSTLPTSPMPGVPLASETLATGPSENRLDMDSRVRATLRNDVAWVSQSNQPLQDRIILVLSEPFRNKAGQGVIPQGAQVVAKVDKLYQGGIFTANVEEFHLPDGKVIRVPAGVIILQQRNRGALQAKLIRPGRGAAAILARIGLGGLNSAAGAIAQGNTSSFYGNGYSSFSQGRSNPLAAGVSGMTGQALNQVNQQTQQQFQGQSNASMYSLSAGAKVDLYVKQDINL